MIWGETANYVGENLEAEGLSAAQKGRIYYIAFLDNLTTEQKAIVKPYHAAWSKIANERR